MEIRIKNTSVKFLRVKEIPTVEESTTMVFTGTGTALVKLTLQKQIPANTDVEVSISGDSGVVSGNRWNVRANDHDISIGGGMTLVKNTGDTFTINLDTAINSMALQRDTCIGAGRITLSIKYKDYSAE